MSNNLYDNFRKNGGNIKQTPSDRAWRRLENRLDGSEGVQRSIGLRRWIMAASVLLLLGITAAMLVMIERPTTITADRQINAVLVAEDLSYTDVEVGEIAAVQLQKRFDNPEWQPINEGEEGRKLVAVKINSGRSHAAQPTSAREEMLRTRKGKKLNLEHLQEHIAAKNDAVISGLKCSGRICSFSMKTKASGKTEKFELTDKTDTEFEFWSLGKGYPEVVFITAGKTGTYTVKVSGGRPSKQQKEYLSSQGFVFGKGNEALMQF